MDSLVFQIDPFNATDFRKESTSFGFTLKWGRPKGTKEHDSELSLRLNSRSRYDFARESIGKTLRVNF